MSGARLPEEIRQEMLRLWMEDYTIIAASERLQLNYETVKYWFTRFKSEHTRSGFESSKADAFKKKTDKILENLDLLVREFQEVHDKLRAKLEEWEHDPEKSREFIETAKVLIRQYEVALRKHGALRDMTVFQQTNIQQNVNMDFHAFIADLGAEEQADGSLKIPNPKPELLEVIRRGRKKTSVEVPA